MNTNTHELLYKDEVYEIVNSAIEVLNTPGHGLFEKLYSEMTLDIYDYMARMLFYLPDKHRKSIRYYGIYAHGIEKKLEQITRKTWAAAIQSSFDKNPELCPDCGSEMIESTVFAYEADRQ